MKKQTAMLREFLRQRQKIMIPGVSNALGARIVKKLGFEAVYLGGWDTGANLATPEPLLTLTEQVEIAASLVRSVDLPLIVDGDAGFGDAVHTTRAVRMFEYAGIAGIHIEDQVYPKRASYHRGLEHVISLEEFETKIRHALAARNDPDFIIIGRTDAFRAVEGSYEEGIHRCKALIDLGVDAIFPFPWGTPPEEYVQKFRKDVPDDIPVMALAGLNKFSAEDWWNMGYHLLIYPLTSAIVTARAIMTEYKALKESGNVTMSPGECRDVRLEIQDLIGLNEYYEIENQTTEKQ
jgi:methylisocitrate lyase